MQSASSDNEASWRKDGKKINIQGTRIVDLSHTIEQGIPVPVGFQKPEIDFFLSLDDGSVVNAEVLTMVIHMATHVDAPYHFYSDGKSADILPPDCIIGPAVVVDMSHKKGRVPIDVKDLQKWEEESNDYVQKGDALLLRTDHSKLWGVGEEGDKYRTTPWPYVTRELVDHLVAKEIRLIGVETMDPDLIDPENFETAEFPAHRTFLKNNILIIENLANLDQIPVTRCQLIATPLKLKGASGSPVRVIAVF